MQGDVLYTKFVDRLVRAGLSRTVSADEGKHLFDLALRFAVEFHREVARDTVLKIRRKWKGGNHVVR